MTTTLQALHFPLHGSRLIEASAGTGKTFTLALLYTRLVLGHGAAGQGFARPLTPREILVVTFTEAAANELRDRIRSRLVEAAEHFGAHAPARSNKDPLQQLRDSYPPAQWPVCRWRLQLAAEAMDEASVSTIHGWCKRMLAEHAFDTRGLFQRELVSDTTELLAGVVRDYWRQHFYALSATQAALVLQAFATPKKLQEALRGLLQTDNQGLSFCGQPLPNDALLQALSDAETLHQLAARVREAWRLDWDQIREHLLALRPCLNGTKHDSSTENKFESLLAALHDWAFSGAKAPSKLPNFASGQFVFKKGKEQPIADFAAFRYLRQWLDAVAAQSNAPDLKALVLAHCASWVRATLAQRLRQRAEMGFDDLLTELDSALDPQRSGSHAAHLAATLRQQFPIAMIDEFQDTDPLQYRIFDRIYRLQENHTDTGIFMIGDPKQAIYSFRGADIHSYLQARSATSERHYTLMRNFRSTIDVVSACNSLFKHADAQARGAFRFKTEHGNPIPFVAVEAAGRAQQLYLPGEPGGAAEPAAALTLWYFTGDENGPLRKEDYRQRAAQSAASQICSWLQAAVEGGAGFVDDSGTAISEQLKPADIAVLVRTGKEAAIVRKALTQRGVASVYLSHRDSLFNSSEAKDVLQWLQACATPGDERLVRAALAANTLQLPLTDMIAWQHDELAWEQQMAHFIHLHALWQRQGVLVMLHRLLQIWDLPARLLQQPDGGRALTNLLHLAEWLQQASAELDGEQALIRHLSEHLGRNDEQQLLRLESDDDLVRVITIHKSKGLEYPLVLLPFIADWRCVDGNTKSVTWRHEQQRYREIAGNTLFASAWQAADDERISEDMRLLYVALTRASHALWLGVAALASSQYAAPLQGSALGYLLAGDSGPVDENALCQQLQTLADSTPAITLQAAPAASTGKLTASVVDELALPLALPALGRLNDWWIASYSAITYQGQQNGVDNTLDVDTRETTPPTDSDSERASDELAHELADESPATAPAMTQPGASGLMHHFPAGSSWGTFLHGLLEWAALHHFDYAGGSRLAGFAAAVADDAGRLDQVARRCRLRRISQHSQALSDWLRNFLLQTWHLPASKLALNTLCSTQIAVEMEFLLAIHQVDTRVLDRLVSRHTLQGVARPAVRRAQLNGMLKGFIDLVIEHEGRYYVIDWKSNRLGDRDDDYNLEALSAAVLKKRYDLQYALYLLALHRQLKARLPDYDYEQHMGGAIYAFLRGSDNADTQGLFYERPPQQLIESLDALFRSDSIRQHAEDITP